LGKKTKKASAPALPPLAEELPSAGKRLFAAGGVLLALGLLLVARADALGRNLPARVAPFLILGGYALMAFGLWRRPSPPSSPVPER
jgi:hypothetical protein